MYTSMKPFLTRFYCCRTMTVLVETKGPICKITLNRPEVKNAIDYETAELLTNKIIEFEKNESTKVGILSGISTFCAGADLKAIAENQKMNRSEEDGNGPLGPTRHLLKKPMVAAISGYAVAGGLELALWCDLRVMEEDAVLGIFCRKWGVPLIDGGTVRLPRLIGMSRALDLILTGRPVYANEALAMGLVNRVVPKGKSMEEAERIALEIASHPQECMLSDRESVYLQYGKPLESALQDEFLLGKRIINRKYFTDNVSKFFRK